MNLLSYWSNITETRRLKSCGCVFEDRLACGLYRLMDWCLEVNMGVFLLWRSKDASRHCVTEQLYTGSTELVPLFLNLIRDRDGRFSERLSCEASRSSLTIDSVWDVSVRIQRLFESNKELSFLLIPQRQWQKVNFVLVPYVQTTEQLLPSGCETENSFKNIQQEGFVFIRLRFFLSLNEGDVTPEIFRWIQELITFNFTNHKTTF